MSVLKYDIPNFEPLLSATELLKETKHYLNNVSFNSPTFQELLKELQTQCPHEGYGHKKYKLSEAIAIIVRKHGIKPTLERLEAFKERVKTHIKKTKPFNLNSSTIELDSDELVLIKEYKQKFSNFLNGIKTSNKLSKIKTVNDVLIFER